MPPRPSIRTVVPALDHSSLNSASSVAARKALAIGDGGSRSDEHGVDGFGGESRLFPDDYIVICGDAMV
jgi:hypothetical protein